MKKASIGTAAAYRRRERSVRSWSATRVMESKGRSSTFTDRIDRSGSGRRRRVFSSNFRKTPWARSVSVWIFRS